MLVRGHNIMWGLLVMWFYVTGVAVRELGWVRGLAVGAALWFLMPYPPRTL